jgi:hypothetical protein
MSIFLTKRRLEGRMASVLLIAVLSQPSMESFTQVEGFADLDAVATPCGFGLLLIESGDPAETESLAGEVNEILDILELDACGQMSLYRVPMSAEGYPDIAALAGEYPSPPAVVVLVGYCGFLQLDPSILEAEIGDNRYMWGGGSVSGICNFCKRCNP